jgi:hypothetical protein
MVILYTVKEALRRVGSKDSDNEKGHDRDQDPKRHEPGPNRLRDFQSFLMSFTVSRHESLGSQSGILTRSYGRQTLYALWHSVDPFRRSFLINFSSYRLRSHQSCRIKSDQFIFTAILLPLLQGFTCQDHQHVWLRQSSSFPSNPIVQFVLSFTIKVVYAISSSPRDFQLLYDEFDIKQYEDCRPSATRMDQAEVAVADVLPMSKAR